MYAGAFCRSAENAQPLTPFGAGRSAPIAGRAREQCGRNYHFMRKKEDVGDFQRGKGGL